MCVCVCVCLCVCVCVFACAFVYMCGDIVFSLSDIAAFLDEIYNTPVVFVNSEGAVPRSPQLFLQGIYSRREKRRVEEKQEM